MSLENLRGKKKEKEKEKVWDSPKLCKSTLQNNVNSQCYWLRKRQINERNRPICTYEFTD